MRRRACARLRLAGMGGLLLLVLVPLAWSGAPTPLDPARSLFVTDRAVLDAPSDLFTLARVLDQLIAQSGVPNLTRLTLWQQWWDTLNPMPGLGLGPHCDTRTTPDGLPGLNGFPLDCPRDEGGEIRIDPFGGMGFVVYRPIALVNRFDLTPLSGAHCGEYRLIFARTPAPVNPRNFLIFEAVLPNPTPELGLEGCRPVAEFWAGLSAIDDPTVRAQALADFYFVGLPGFPPVVSIAHYARGQGQIRTNMFIEPLWQLREFELVLRCPRPEKPCTALRVRPVTVKDNPFGPLWDDTAPEPKGPGFRRRVLRQLLPGLLVDDLMLMTFQVPNRFNAGQSSAQGFENDYPVQLAQGGFATALQEALTALGSDLTPTQVARRAMTQSCAGCHQLSAFGPPADLGHGLTWPASLGFVHVDELGRLSPALRDVFLPHRLAVLETFLAGAVGELPGVARIAGTAVELTIGGPRRTH